MELIDPFEKLSEHYNATKVRERISSLCHNVSQEGRKAGLIIYRNILGNGREIDNSVYVADSYYLRSFVIKYIEYKNTLMKMAQSPLYGFFYQYAQIEHRVKNIAYYMLTIECDNFDQLINRVKEQIHELIKVHTIVFAHQEAQQFTEDLELINAYKEFDFVEKYYFDQLKNERFDDDELYRKFEFDLDILAIGQLFGLFKESHLLLNKFSFPMFARAMYPSSSNKIFLNLKGSEFKSEDLGLLFYLLFDFYPTDDKNQYIKFIIKKFEIISKRGSRIDYSKKQYKNQIRPYNKNLDSLTSNQEIILNCINTIKELRKVQ